MRSHLLRGILAVSIAALIILPCYTILLLNPSFTRLVMELTEADVERNSAHITSMLFAQKRELNRDSVTMHMINEIKKLKDDFNLLKVKIFLPSGEIIYSTDPGDIGHVTTGSYFHELVAGGQKYTKVVWKNERSPEDHIVPVDIVETYVPLMRGNKFIGAINIYHDITERKAGLDRLITQSSVVVISIAFGLLIAVVLISLKANRTILKHSRAQEELSKYRNHLEDLVEERTAKLTVVNERLKHEIMERTRVEDALRRAAEEWKVTFDSISDFVSVHDRDFRIVKANKALADFVGMEPEEMLGRHCYEVFHGTGKMWPNCPHARMIETKKTATEEINDPNMGRPLLVTASPIFNEKNEIIGSVQIAKDITERKRMEEELQKAQNLESLGILAGGIAHDFNNLLAGILGNISLAETHTMPEDKIYNMLINAENASLRARDLTNQLLTFSKGSPAVKETLSVSGLIKDSAEFPLIGSSVMCEYAIADDLWPVEIDKGQINRVIHNLILNAREAMPEGGTITIRAENLSVGRNDALPLKSGKYVKISVEDSGVGIPEEKKSKIFDPYFTTKDMGSQKGMGLGLAICYSIIKSHKGLITVKSKEGKGSTFNFYLPASEKTTLPDETRKDTKKKPLTAKGKILLMDDEEIVRNVCGEMLIEIGCEVQFARDGSEAVEQYKKSMESEQAFAAVILDLTIQGETGGVETVKRLIEIDPDVKAIVSSGYSNDPTMLDYREYGFRGVIKKPYQIEELSEVLNNVMVAKG